MFIDCRHKWDKDLSRLKQIQKRYVVKSNVFVNEKIPKRKYGYTCPQCKRGRDKLPLAGLCFRCYKKNYDRNKKLSSRPFCITRIMLSIGYGKKRLKTRHPQRLAVDFNIFRNGLLINSPVDIKPIGDYWVSLHTDNVWGGDWNRNNSILDETFIDAYHFEMKP